MNRWVDDEPESSAAKAVASIAALPPRPVDLTRWDQVLTDASVARPDWRLPAAFLASVMLGMAIVVALRGPPTAPLRELAPAMTASSNATWVIAPDGAVHLSAGSIAVTQQSSTRVLVVTPQVSISAQQCRFSAAVTSEGTLVTVDEGEVVVRAGDQRRTLQAGASVAWPSSTLEVKPAESESSCPHNSEASRAECLEREAQGEGLAAQAALYELGSLQARQSSGAAAIQTWSRSLTRFPSGVLNPEVRIALILELKKQHRVAEALKAARDFESHCADDPRRGEITTVRQALERAQ